MKKSRLLLVSSFFILSLVITSCRSSTTSVGAQGPQGPQGEKGLQGIPGLAGIDGAPGQPGIQGETGAQGPIGPRGFTGAAGAQGPTGPAGPNSGSSVVVPKLIGPLTNAQKQTYISNLNAVDIDRIFPESNSQVTFDINEWYSINSIEAYVKFATYNNHLAIVDFVDEDNDPATPESEILTIQKIDNLLPNNNEFYSGKFVLGTNIDFDDILLSEYSLTNTYELMVGYKSFTFAFENNDIFYDNSPFAFYGFTGVFDGANHTISNFYIDVEDTNLDSIGLFYTSENFQDTREMVFKNIILEDFVLTYDVQENQMSMGALVGFIGANKVSINNIIVNNPILTSNSPTSDNMFSSIGLGGLVGETGSNNIFLNNVHVVGGSIYETGNANIGGLIGAINSASISILNSSNSAYINSSFIGTTPLVNGGPTTNNSVGGLAGTISGSRIVMKHSSNSANVFAQYSSGVGGLLGSILYSHQFELDNVYNSGNVIGYNDVGGFVGILNPINNNLFSLIYQDFFIFSSFSIFANIVSFDSSAVVNNSYNVGNILALDEYAGGFIGTIDFLSNKIPYFDIFYSNEGLFQEGGSFLTNYSASLSLNISNSYTSSSIISMDHAGAGGLIGYFYNLYTDYVEITDPAPLDGEPPSYYEYYFIPSVNLEIRNVFIENTDLNNQLDDPIIGSFGLSGPSTLNIEPYQVPYLGFTKLIFKDIFMFGETIDDIYGATIILESNIYFKNNEFIFNRAWDIGSTWILDSNINNGLPTLKFNVHQDSQPLNG